MSDARANAASFLTPMGSKEYGTGGRCGFRMPFADAHSARRGQSGKNDADLLVDLKNVSTATLPTWDDSEGTVYLEDGNGNARAVSWSSAGYAVSENGSIIARYPDPALTADPPHRPGKTFYISDSLGSDSHNGLHPTFSGGLNGPKKSVSAANSLSLSPGDAVLFRRGDTWTDVELRPDASGSPSNYIKYGAYGSGNDPLFDGNNVRQHLLHCGHSHIWFDSLDFYNGEGHDIRGQILFWTGGHDCYVTNCRVRSSNKTGMVTFGARTRVFNCSFEDNYYWGLSLGASDGTMRNHVIANCTFTGNSAGKDPTGSTGTEPLVGVNTNTVVFGCHFYDNHTSDHHLYRGWSGKENDQSQGLARIHDNVFDGTVGTASGSPIGCKGRGARVFRNKLYKTGGQGIAASIGSAPDGGTPFNLTYSHHNLVLDLDDSHEAGGLVLTALALKEANGRGAVHHWNNTVDVGQRGAIITRNRMTVDGNTFTMRNNLISRQRSHAVELRTVVEFVDIDYNYYHDYNDSFRVNGKRKTDEQWQAHGYDLHSQMDAADPQFGDFARAALTSRDYNLKTTSPARGTGTDAVQLVDTDPDAWIGINYVPHATTPDAGAYQCLSAKTIDFSRYFVGLRCKDNLAQRFKLWRTAKKANSLRALTSA